MAPIICCIDGIIGSGKTTALQELESRGCVVFQEDVDEWLPYLNAFYVDKKRWSFTLQMEILQSLTSQYKKIKRTSQPFVLVERCPKSCAIFARNSYNLGYMTDSEYALFSKYYNMLNPWTPDVTCVIDASVDACLERVRQRARLCEADIDRQYLTNLNSEYARFHEPSIITIDGSATPTRVADQIIGVVNAFLV
jgi:deoxyguanosine kinase